MNASLILNVLGDAAIKSTAILLVATLLTLLMRRASAAMRHLIWIAAVAVALLLPAGSALLPIYRIPLLPAVSVPTPQPVETVTTTVPHPAVAATAPPMDVNPGGDERASPVPKTKLLSPAEPMTPSAPPVVAPTQVVAAVPARHHASARLPAIVLSIWSLGAVCVAAYWLIGFAAARRLRRVAPEIDSGRLFDAMQFAQRQLGLRRKVQLRVGGLVPMPLTCGTLHPQLFLPLEAETWSLQQLQSALLHELAHVKRLDCAAQSVAHWTCALYWFNPLAWLAAGRLRIERERACDDLVLSHGAAPASYAEHLLAVARLLRDGLPPRINAIAMARSSGLRRRVMDILDVRTNRRALSTRLILAAVVIAAVVFVPMSAIHLGARNVAHAQSVPTTHPSTKPTQTLHLTVVDKANGLPIAGATINYQAPPHDGHAVTDAGGHADIGFSPSSGVNLHAESPNYAAKFVGWGRGKTPADYSLQMDAGIRIGGKILDDAGRPVSSAHVKIGVDFMFNHELAEWFYFANKEVLTAADGTWHFNSLPAEVKNKPNIDGFPPDFTPPPLFSISVRDDQHIDGDYFPVKNDSDLSALQNKTVIYTLKRRIPVTGTVSSPEGKPLAGAKVTFGGKHFPGSSDYGVTTNEHGIFAVGMLKKPEVTLTTSAKGYAPDIQEILVVDKPVAVEVHLKAANSVNGTVVNEAGEPVSRASIWFKVWHGDWIYLHQSYSNKKGEFTWAEAPTERLTVATRASGYRDKDDVIMTAGTPARIVVESLMTVSGTVVDAETGMPIQSFTVIHGEDDRNGEPIEWTPWPQVGMINGANGKFSYAGEIHEPEHALRIEADGYIPGESRQYTENERHVQLEFRLTRGPDLVNKVFTADDKPAVGAEAVLVENGNWLEIEEVGWMVEDPCQHVKVTADGTVRFKPAAKDFKVVVFDQNGMAQATAEQWRASRPLVLQPWARIEGTCQVGNMPAAKQDIQLYQGADVRTAAAPEIRFEEVKRTDSAGHFIFDHAPPGEVQIGQIINEKVPSGYQWAGIRYQGLSLNPGQTVHLTLGGTGRPVEGHLKIPPGTAQYAFLYGTAASADHVDKIPIRFGEDGSGHFRIDDVPAGTYDCHFTISKGSGRAGEPPNNHFFAAADSMVIVPPMPGGRSDEPLQIPTVPMHMLADFKAGQAAPDFSVTAIDGSVIKLSDLRGKYVLLNFWAASSWKSVEQQSLIKMVNDTYGQKGRLSVINLSLDDQLEDVRSFLQQNNLNWPQVFLADGWLSPIAKAYDVAGVPSIWLISPDGKVVAKNLQGEGILSAVKKALGG